MDSDFYLKFENKFRGTRELIKGRLRIYSMFLEPLQRVYPESTVLDLGCGRGEWLELIREFSFAGEGVDQDEPMLEQSRELGLNVRKGDALAALKALPDASVSLVSGFHIAEHLDFNDLGIFISEALRVLLPGGILILETPNPENIMVGTWSFYTDPTHKKPLPPQLLSFLVEYSKFYRNTTLRLQGKKYVTEENITLTDVLVGSSADYAVVGQKESHPDILKLFDNAFKISFGTSLVDMSEKYQKKSYAFQEQININSSQIREIDARLQQVERELTSLHNSVSWKITAPLRLVKYQFEQIQTVGLRQTFKNNLFSLAKSAIAYIERHERLNNACLKLSERLGIRGKIHSLRQKYAAAANPDVEACQKACTLDVDLTNHADVIYRQLGAAYDAVQPEKK